MTRRLLSLCLLLALLTACAAQDTPTQGYTFTDAVGTQVTVSPQPQKVAVLFSSFAQIWTLAGGTVSVTVGESIERGFAPEGTALVDSGAGKTIDHELLLAQQPDFIIGSADISAHADACKIAAQAGIPAALFRVDTFDDYLAMLKICTDLTGNAEAYETYGTAVAAQIAALLEAAPKNADTQYLFIRAGSQFSSTKAKRSPENFVCRMLDTLGAHNIADDAPLLLDSLSLEEILLRDPDHIFLTTMGDENAAKAYVQELFTQDGWQELTAVKTGNYTFLPKDLFHYKPNHRWDEAYAMLAQILYGEGS